MNAQDLGLNATPYDPAYHSATTGAPLWDPVQVGHAYRNALP
jgi:hypothetical protein